MILFHVSTGLWNSIFCLIFEFNPHAFYLCVYIIQPLWDTYESSKRFLFFVETPCRYFLLILVSRIFLPLLEESLLLQYPWLAEHLQQPDQSQHSAGPEAWSPWMLHKLQLPNVERLSVKKILHFIGNFQNCPNNLRIKLIYCNLKCGVFLFTIHFYK